MPRLPRRDRPHTWHHVMNQGLAQRTIFESERDCRFFLSLVAQEVQCGRIRLIAYSLMLNHYHLLVYSVTGELSEAMRRIQYRYARWFNRTRNRRGPLFIGRFRSKPVETRNYLETVFCYIHDNPVAARVVDDPADYEGSSAWYLARPWDKVPAWLDTRWLAGQLLTRGYGATPAERFVTALPRRLEPASREWIEKKLRPRPDAASTAGEREAITLEHRQSPRVLGWALRNARRADGTRPWHAVCPTHLVERAIKGAKRRVGPLLGLFARKAKDAWIALRAGLLRLLAGCSHREIAMRVHRHSSTISRDIRDHLRLVNADRAYAELANELGRAILAAAR